MNVRRVVRVGGTVVLVTGTAVLAVAAPAGATLAVAGPGEATDPPSPRVADETRWFDDVDALAEAFARQGDTAGAASAHDLAAMYQDLVVAGRRA